MPQYQCQQPDGKWAIFSTVVDDFTWVNLDEEDCRGVMLHQYNYSPETVERGFRIARREEEATTPFLEYHWWEECIGAIASVHGRKALRETLSEIGLGEKKEG